MVDEVPIGASVGPADPSLAEFVAAAPEFSSADRRKIIDQALLLIEQLYVHLPLKRAMYAVDPVQHLKLLHHRVDDLSERQFHEELIATLRSVRDLHTTYTLPDPYRQRVAVLPFRLERCFDGDKPRYLVTALEFGFSHESFAVAVEVTHWNGIPVQRAVEQNGDLTSAGNREARLARGLDSLTHRPMSLLAAPVEDWVVISYLADGARHDIRFIWQVLEIPPPPVERIAAPGDVPAAATYGIDRLVEELRRTKKAMFAPDKVALDRRIADADPTVDLRVHSAISDALEFRALDTPGRQVGYLRIRTFNVPDVDAFVDEVLRIVNLLPATGLIIDVRGNGGGAMAAGERLLQLFTPRPIEPERAHFINTPLTLRLVTEVPWLAAWHPSMEQSVELGTVYSDGFPIEDGHLERCNALGQRYFGPVLLIVDALCYSATDIFAAGFQDHGIGPVLGTDGNTGAGGANAWEQAFLTTLLPDVFPALPGHSGLGVAVRQTRRVGERAGDLLEDLGVVPDEVHRMTRDDVLNANVDLIARATTLLAGMPSRHFDVAAEVPRDGGLLVRLTTAGLTRVDVYVDGRPRSTLDVQDGQQEVEVPVTGPGPHRLELCGYDGGGLVARRRFVQ